MESPLTNLSKVLATVRASANSYEATLKKNEAATRAVLVDPVLRALGWDIANPFMVEVEARGNFEGPINADYGLKNDGEVKIVVEAKKLGVELKKEYPQIVRYSFGFEVNQVFLTDGIVWKHFTKFEPGNLSDSKTLDISSDDLEEVAAYLVQELDSALTSPQQAKFDELSEQVNQLREEIEKLRPLDNRVKALELVAQKVSATEGKKVSPSSTSKSTFTPKKVPSPPSLSWTLLSEVTGVQGTKPSHLRLPDGTEISVKSWQQVLSECCSYTIQSRSRIKMPLIDSARKTTNLIQESPLPTNSNSKETEINGKTFHIRTSYSAELSVRNALYVLKLFAKTSDKTQAKVVYG